MIDRNYTVIVDKGQFHCIVLEKVITGKRAFVTDLNQSDGPFVFSPQTSAPGGDDNIKG